MSKRLQSRAAVVVVAIIATCLGLMGILRIREAKQFSQPHPVQTDGGTN